MEFAVTVYPEETDASGLVPHHALVRFLARARSEAFEAMGKSQWAWEAEGYRFPAYHLEASFPGFARLGDRLTITTEPKPLSPYRLAFIQRIRHGETLIAAATMEVVFTDTMGRLLPIPTFPPASGV